MDNNRACGEISTIETNKNIMPTEKDYTIKDITITPSYGGGVAVHAYLPDGSKCVIEMDEVKRILRQRLEIGFTLDLKPRMKYYRLIPNN